MLQPIDTRVPSAVEERVHSIYRGLFPQGEVAFVPRAFQWASQCFAGQYADYQPIDAAYHDFEHTLQGTLCFTYLLKGRHLANAQPPLTQRMFELGLLAILFHDTGYLKRKDDSAGTGAKYTLVHVGRSMVFAGEFLSQKGYAPAEVTAVQNMIRCTGVNADVRSIPFQSELEKTIGFALATADLLGQMAAKDYVEKLPVLYQEFAEAARFSKDSAARLASFASAEDLMRKTPAFWDGYVIPRINGEFRQLHLFLNEPYPDGPNGYLDRIEERIAKLRQKFK
jgi:hypothetical protein